MRHSRLIASLFIAGSTALAACSGETSDEHTGAQSGSVTAANQDPTTNTGTATGGNPTGGPGATGGSGASGPGTPGNAPPVSGTPIVNPGPTPAPSGPASTTPPPVNGTPIVNPGPTPAPSGPSSDPTSPTGTACGSSVCGKGYYCCDAEASRCAKVGWMCTKQ